MDKIINQLIAFTALSMMMTGCGFFEAYPKALDGQRALAHQRAT